MKMPHLFTTKTNPDTQAQKKTIRQRDTMMENLNSVYMWNFVKFYSLFDPSWSKIHMVSFSTVFFSLNCKGRRIHISSPSAICSFSLWLSCFLHYLAQINLHVAFFFFVWYYCFWGYFHLLEIAHTKYIWHRLICDIPYPYTNSRDLEHRHM